MKNLNKPWLIMLGMYLVALLGILFPTFAEWPIIPVIFLALIPAFWKQHGTPNWWRFAAMLLGALSIQILFWL